MESLLSSIMGTQKSIRERTHTNTFSYRPTNAERIRVSSIKKDKVPLIVSRLRTLFDVLIESIISFPVFFPNINTSFTKKYFYL